MTLTALFSLSSITNNLSITKNNDQGSTITDYIYLRVTYKIQDLRVYVNFDRERL